MNNYIKIGVYKYRTQAWVPVIGKIVTVRKTRLGATDATSASFKTIKWRGMIEASICPDDNFGTPTTLRDVLILGSPSVFEDHYGNVYSVLVKGSIVEKSISPVLNARDNVILFAVEVTSQ